LARTVIAYTCIFLFVTSTAILITVCTGLGSCIAGIPAFIAILCTVAKEAVIRTHWNTVARTVFALLIPITPKPRITIFCKLTILKTKLSWVHRNGKRLLILISYLNLPGSKFSALFRRSIFRHIAGKTEKVACAGLDYIAEGKKEYFITSLLIFVACTGKSRDTISNCTFGTGEKIILIANCHLKPPYSMDWIIKTHIYQILMRTTITLMPTDCEGYFLVFTIGGHK
jgi:hypothetical protein